MLRCQILTRAARSSLAKHKFFSVLDHLERGFIMTSEVKTLAEIFVTCGMEEKRAMNRATDLYANNSTVMFRAILCAYLARVLATTSD